MIATDESAVCDDRVYRERERDDRESVGVTLVTHLCAFDWRGKLVVCKIAESED